MNRYIKEFFMENWSLKLTAVLLSLILWLFVRGEPGQVKFISGVPLEVRVPRHMEITYERPTSVDVTLRGTAFSNMLIGQPNPTCIIDLQGANEGEHTITLTKENIAIPRGSGIEVTKVNPDTVSVILERTLSKEVPIVVPVRGDPARGYEMYAKYSKPSTAVITGPRSHVDPINEIPTESVSISGLKQPTKFYVGLNIKDTMIRTGLTNPLQVDIQVGTRRKLSTVAQIPVIIDGPSYYTSPPKIAVQLLAPVDMIPDLSAADMNVFIPARTLDNLSLPAKVKPQVSIMNSKIAASALIKDVIPPEVTVFKKKK